MTNDTLNQEHIAIIRKMLVRHDTLHPRIFNEKGDVYPFIRDQLMQSTQFMVDMVVSAFPKLKVSSSMSVLALKNTFSLSSGIFRRSSPLRVPIRV